MKGIEALGWLADDSNRGQAGSTTARTPSRSRPMSSISAPSASSVIRLAIGRPSSVTPMLRRRQQLSG